MIEQKFDIEGDRAEIIEEHFHPSGSVKFTNLINCQAVGYSAKFDVELKEELRRA